MTHPLVETWYSAARDALPPGVDVWDGHTHTGNADPDGVRNSDATLLAALDGAGHSGAVIFTSADPTGYRAHNDRILREASAANGRLIPFARLDPTLDAVAQEAARCLGDGHRGFKLHPRSERFTLDHPGVTTIAAVAAAHRVPLLIHAGRGMPPLGKSALKLLDDNPGLVLILAHAGISDLSWIAGESRTRPGLMFDTAWWNVADLAYLFGSVDASQIIYASDMPYWEPQVAATLALRSSIQAGLSGPGISAVFGGNLKRALDGPVEPQSLGVGVPGHADPLLHRVAANLYTALGPFSEAPFVEGIELALRAAELGGTPYDELLSAVRDTLGVVIEMGDADPFQTAGVLMIACSAVLTPAAPVPDLG